MSVQKDSVAAKSIIFTGDLIKFNKFGATFTAESGKKEMLLKIWFDNKLLYVELHNRHGINAV